ncbi:hypothetical protein Q5752_002869 [Cryptotrichosporon argae]
MASHRVIVITGASSGIGRACAVALSHAFPSAARPEPLVLVLAGRRAAELDRTAGMCKEGTVTECVAGDASDEADVERLFAVVEEKWGRVDVLFNNAGINLLGATPLVESDMDTFRKVLDVNIMSAVLCTRAATRLMATQLPRGGRIINNGSISSRVPRPHSASYTLSKHALLGLTKCTALDGRAHAIKCTQLDIGNAATAIGSHVAAGSLQADGSVKVEPTMDVKHVADTVCYIAGLDDSVDVFRLEVIAAGMPYVGRG